LSSFLFAGVLHEFWNADVIDNTLSVLTAFLQEVGYLFNHIHLAEFLRFLLLPSSPARGQ
jgi:hypothetical protein